jgi:hypothetical protein
MKSFSAPQLEIDYVGAETSSENTRTNPSGVAFAPSKIKQIGAPVTPLQIPNFGTYSEVYAVTSRMAGRLNAAGVSEQEHNGLLQERQALLDKKLGGTISRRETNRLELVRWSLDRIEDARTGQALDVLEATISRYERLMSELQNLEQQLREQAHPRRNRQW